MWDMRRLEDELERDRVEAFAVWGLIFSDTFATAEAEVEEKRRREKEERAAGAAGVA
jgi:hypothetical protein